MEFLASVYHVTNASHSVFIPTILDIFEEICLNYKNRIVNNSEIREQHKEIIERFEKLWQSGSYDKAVTSCPASTLAAGDSMDCTGYYLITQDDIDNREVINIATASGISPVGTMVEDDSDSTNPADDSFAK